MRSTRASLGALGVAACVLLAIPDAAVAASHSVKFGFTCQASTPIGVRRGVTSPSTYTAKAPAEVASGAQYTEEVAAPTAVVPTSLGGFRLLSVRDLVLRFRVSTEATIRSVRLVGGASPGATAQIVGNQVYVRAPAVVAAGHPFNLPHALVRLQATGGSHSVIRTDVPGTSYADWTTQITARFAVGAGIDVRASCYAQPVGPVLMLTKIR